MAKLQASIVPKLSRLVLMLSSNQPGEVVAAASAIDRTLRAAGADWHALADTITNPPVAPECPPPKRPPPPPHTPTWADVSNPKQFLETIQAETWISEWEREFAISIRENLCRLCPRPITSKQRAVLDRLVRRAVDHGVPL